MSQLYPQGKAHILGKTTQVDFATDTFKLLLYDGPYNGAHEYISDLVGADIVARSGALGGVTITAGDVDANDITLVAISGSPFAGVILVKSTGVDATSPLIVFFDISTYTPNGGDINVIVNASGLFAI